MTDSATLTALKEIPDLYELADEIEANGMIEAASKVRAVAVYVDAVEAQLDGLLALVANRDGRY